MIRIDINTKTTGEKQFAPRPDKLNGLNWADLASIEIREMQEPVEATSKWISYRGLKPSTISFKFVEHGVTDEPATYYHSFMPICPKDEKYDNKVNAFTQMIGHFLEEIRGDKNVVLVTKDAAGKEVDPKALSGQELVDCWTRLFTDTAKCFYDITGEKGKEVITPKFAGKSFFIKLLLYQDGRPVKNGNYAMPMYPKDGVIELYQEGKAPKLSIKLEKGESITPMPKVNPATNPTQMPGTPGANPFVATPGAAQAAPAWFPKA